MVPSPGVIRVGKFSEKKKICLICATPLTLHFFFRQHIETLSHDFDVTVIYNREIDSYINIDDLPAQKIYVPLQRKISPFNDVYCLILLTWHFLFNRYDHIWAIAPKAGLIATFAGWLTRISVRLFVFQGEVWATERGLKRFLLKNIDRLIAATASHVLSVSEGERKFLIHERVVDPNKINVLKPGSICGVDIKRFTIDPDTRVQMRQKLGFQEGDRVCLFLGRIRRDKGVLDLANAFHNARNQGCERLKLLIIGPDEDSISEEISKIIFPYSDDVVLHSFAADPAPFLSASDLFCLPSYREGFPISILEAAAMEIPTIGSRIYGIEDAILNRMTGILFEPRNITELKQCLIEFYSQIDFYQNMGKKARERVVSSFDSQSIVKNYVNYIRSIGGSDK